MVGVRIGLVCDQLREAPPAGRLVGVSYGRRLGLPWLHGHALQSGTGQVRVPRRRYDFGDAYQPELVCFSGDSDSLPLAAPSLVWNLGFLRVSPPPMLLLTPDCEPGSQFCPLQRLSVASNINRPLAYDAVVSAAAARTSWGFRSSLCPGRIGCDLA